MHFQPALFNSSHSFETDKIISKRIYNSLLNIIPSQLSSFRQYDLYHQKIYQT